MWHANWMRFNLGWSLAGGERPSRYRTLVSPIKRGCEADVGAVRVIHWSVLCRMAAQVRLCIQPLTARTSPSDCGPAAAPRPAQRKLHEGLRLQGDVLRRPLRRSSSLRPRRTSPPPLPCTACAALLRCCVATRVHSLAIGRLVCAVLRLLTAHPPPHYNQLSA